MIIDYALFPYLAITSILLAAAIAVWKAFSAKKTLAALVLAAYLPALFTIEFLPFALENSPILDFDLGIWPVPFSLIAKLLSSPSPSGLSGSCVTLLKMLAVLFPLGLLLPCVFESCIATNRGISTIALTSIGIEAIQSLENAIIGTCSKRISFDEAMLAFLGGIIGYLISRFIVLHLRTETTC